MKTRAAVLFTQVVILALLITSWQYLPEIHALSKHSHIFDPFFVSSPTRVASTLRDLLTGRHGSVLIWPYAWRTIYAALLGTGIGMSLGAALGILLSGFEFLSKVVRPFLVAANATPRIALIPIIVLLFGTTGTASIVVAVLVVGFIAFFNAYEGGVSVSPELLQNAKLLGASRWRVLWFIRAPYAFAWTFVALPTSIAFAIISVVTAEILTGYAGMGRLIQVSTTEANASLTFAVVIVLAILGVVAVIAADLARARLLHWWAR